MILPGTRIRQANKYNSIYVLDSSIVVPSVGNLTPGLTINGTVYYPSARYYGSQATILACNASVYGSNLAITGSGTDVSIGQTSPFYGSLDGGVKTVYASKGFIASANTVYDITTYDYIVEIVLKFPDCSTNNYQRVLAKFASNLGYEIYFANSSGNTILYSVLNNVARGATATLAPNTTNHCMYFCRKAGSAIWYTNAVAGTAVDVSSVGSITSTGTFHLLQSSGLNRGMTSPLYYLAIYILGNNVLDTHLQANLAKERYQRLMGIWPNIANASSLATL